MLIAVQLTQGQIPYNKNTSNDSKEQNGMSVLIIKSPATQSHRPISHPVSPL